MRSTLTFLGILLPLWLGPGGTFAEEAVDAAASAEPESSVRERARQDFLRGVAAYREGQFDVARQSFEAALAIYRSPVFIFNLARTHERLGRPSRALRYYREYERLAPDAKDLPEVKQRIATLESTLFARGVQELVIDTTPSGATLRIDEKDYGTTPFTGEVSNGVHVIRLSLPEHADREITIVTAGSDATDLVYALEPAPPPPPLAPPPAAPPAKPPVEPTLVSPVAAQRDTSPSSGRIGTWTYVTLGASVAALSGAGVLELLRRNSEGDVRELAVQRDRVNAYDTMGNYQTAARISLGAGLGLAALGVTLLVLDLRPERGSAPAMANSLALGPGQLTLRGIW